MKKLMLITVIGILSACGSSSDEEIDPDLKVTDETTEKIEAAQDVNIELERIDGELDSLLNLLD